jgi:glutamate racemase
LIGLAIIGTACGPHAAEKPTDAFTVAVTDSGLGGLSVMAEAAARLEKAGIHKRVDLVFFNALFTDEGGYNSLPTRQEKIRVFDAALRALEREVRPDLILVACNTLSVLLPDTPFFRETTIPMQGIVEPGVEMFWQALIANPEARLILFGTETTIAEDSHRRRLVETGVPAERLIVQACPELQSYIETDWQSGDTGLLISAYVDEATAGLPQPPPPLLAGLVCTHYGYSRDLWAAAFTEQGLAGVTILDPNAKLAEWLVPQGAKRRFDKTDITARVVSMVDIPQAKRDKLAAWLERVSPAVAAALRAAEIRPGLFDPKGVRS